MLIEFTPELVAMAVGAILSWLFGWFPSLRTWYGALKAEVKSGIMLGLLVLVSVVIYVLTRLNVLQVPEPISWWRILTVLYFASTMNQTAYKLTPEAKDVQIAKMNRPV